MIQLLQSSFRKIQVLSGDVCLLACMGNGTRKTGCLNAKQRLGSMVLLCLVSGLKSLGPTLNLRRLEAP